LEAHGELARRWDELACVPDDLNEVFQDRGDELSYETPVGEYLATFYFEL
jgi:hypothetical protein